MEVRRSISIVLHRDSISTSQEGTPWRLVACRTLIHALDRYGHPPAAKAYGVGLPSSRKRKACWEYDPLRVLTGNRQPDHSWISNFRRRHLAALAGLFIQVLRLCQQAQGHEPRADAHVRRAAGGRNPCSAVQGRDHRRPGGGAARRTDLRLNLVPCGASWAQESQGVSIAKCEECNAARPCSFCCGWRILRLFLICPLEE